MNTKRIPVLLAAALLAGCGGGASPTARDRANSRAAPDTVAATSRATTAREATTAGATPAAAARRAKPPPPFPRLLPSALASQPTHFVPVATWHGQTAAWIARTPAGIGLLAFNQNLLALRLHSGTTDAGSVGWRYGPSIAGLEARHLVAAFNGGFRFSYGAGGFMSYGRVAVPLRAGLASIVTYANGTTDIGAWDGGVPARGQQVASVRQNLSLLVDHGQIASTVDCVSCWGSTLGGVVDPARSGVGVTAHGRLIWVGGEHLTVSALAAALLGAGAVRAVELDINPAWVAGYVYGHRGGKGPLAPIPVVPGQVGVSGQYLVPWSRDFFTVVAR
jgi:hypothetical protein